MTDKQTVSFNQSSLTDVPHAMNVRRHLRKAVSTFLSAVIALHPIALEAQQLTPDVSAPSNNRPTVGAAPNGVPLVDIVAPNSSGLSHNKFSDFNVGSPGLILNNSTQQVETSKLGGVVPGNANLTGSGSASVILNEVTTTKRTSLLGPTEILGRKADVIIANPNGITCDGCGFLNTPRVMLTTGVPELDLSGGLSGFSVTGGDVLFGNKGANFAQGDGAVDLFDVVSRSIGIDGKIYGKDVRFSAGRQNFDYGTGKVTGKSDDGRSPAYAIDGTAVGAMQADSIKIIVTDKGAGVRMRGDMAANAGELSISADGKISIANASGSSGVAARSNKDISAKELTSKGSVAARAGSTITLKSVAAEGNLLLNSIAGAVNVSGRTDAQGHLNVAGEGVSFGDIAIGGSVTITTTSADLTLNDVAAGASLHLQSFGNVFSNNLESGANAIVSANGDINYARLLAAGSAQLSSINGSLSTDRLTKANEGISLKARNVDMSGNRGKVETSGLLSIDASTINLSSSNLTFGAIKLSATDFADLTDTTLSALGANAVAADISIFAPTLETGSGTKVIAAGDLNVGAAQFYNRGQFASRDNMRIEVSDSLINGASGLIYSGADMDLFVGGVLSNDLGAITSGGNLSIAGINGQRSQTVVNRSGLISAQNHLSVYASELLNERSSTPMTARELVSSGNTVGFSLNPEVAGRPFAHLFLGANDDGPGQDLYTGYGRQYWEDYKDDLWSEITLADGSSYRAWTWISGGGPDWSSNIRNWIRERAPRNANGEFVPDANDPSRYIIVQMQGGRRDYSTTYSWDWDAHITQDIHEDRVINDGGPQASINAGGSIAIDATQITNAYSAIEAGSDIDLKGSVLENKGISLSRVTTSTCNARSACEAFDKDGNRDPSRDVAVGTSIISTVETIGTESAVIKAGGALIATGFDRIENTAAEGSIAGGSVVANHQNVNDPTSLLSGMTAVGSLFVPSDIPKPQSGGFGGTLPGQQFLYETRAEFLDVSKFYGSSYFLQRMGYQPDRQVRFIGDAYFENQYIEAQLRQLSGPGHNSTRFLPGSDAIATVRSLLENGASFMQSNGLRFGEGLSQEQISSLTDPVVVYQLVTIDGAQVYTPVVYMPKSASADSLASGAMMVASSMALEGNSISNSGLVAAENDLSVVGGNIASSSGTFKAGRDVTLAATDRLSTRAQITEVDGQQVVNTNRSVIAGRDATLSAGSTLSLAGSGVVAERDVKLSGNNIVLDVVKADVGGQQNATGTSLTSGGSSTLSAQHDIALIGSSVTTSTSLEIKTQEGSVNLLSADVARSASDGYQKTTSTAQQGSHLRTGGDTSISSGSDLLISGSGLSSAGNTVLSASNDINLTTAQERSTTRLGPHSGTDVSNSASEVSSGGSLSVAAGSSLSIIGSKATAQGTTTLSAEKDVTIAQAVNEEHWDLHNGNGRIRTDTALSMSRSSSSEISGLKGTTITSGRDVVLSASQVSAGDDQNQADLRVDATGDLIVASGVNSDETHSRSQSKGFLRKNSSSVDSYVEETVGSKLFSSGNMSLNSGKDLAISGSAVTAAGSASLEGNSVVIMGAEEQHAIAEQRKKSGLFAGSGGGFFSLWGKEQKDKRQSSSINVQSEITAGTDVKLTARQADVNVIGSSVIAEQDIALNAARDVNVTPGAERFASSEKEKRSGFGIQFKTGSGSASIGIGYGKSVDQTTQSTNSNASSVLFAGRDLTIAGSRDVNLQAANASADRNVALNAGRDVNLLSSQSTSNYQHIHEQMFAGLTAQVSTGVVSAGHSIASAADKIGNISDGYSAANAAFAGLKAADAISDLSKMAAGKGNIASASVGIGFEYSKTKVNAASSVPVASEIRGGNDVTIEAKSGDINATGAQVTAGVDEYGFTAGGNGGITLSAAKDINLESAEALSSASSSSKSASAGIAYSVGVGTGGATAGWTGSANASAGKSNSVGTTQSNTRISGTGEIALESGRDTNLNGAVVEGNSITAAVGRDLNIISRPDIGKSSNSSVSFGLSGSLSGGVPQLTGISPGFGIGQGSTNWITEQSGLVAEGKIDIDVGGNTHLGAGKIVSDSGELNLSSGTLTHENFSGVREYEGFNISANIDLTGGDKNGVKQQRPDETSQPRSSVEGGYQLDDTRQEVRATVGPGKIDIREDEKQSALEASGQTSEVAALNRDPELAYEITKDKHVEINYYISNTSLESAAKAVDVAGRTIGQAFDAISAQLAASGDLTPSELETAKKVAKALDNGSVNIEALIQCSGRQGFNLMDWIITPAYAATGCVLFDNAGKKIADMTAQEREACVQIFASLMERYANEYLIGSNNGSVELPGSVKTIAATLRKIGSEEQLVAGAQALGMSASFIRDLSVRLSLGKEGYEDFKNSLAPLALAGELTKEAAERAIGNLAASHGLSSQDTKDLKLVVGVTTAAILGGIGIKAGLSGKVAGLGDIDDFLAKEANNINQKIGTKLGQGRLPFPKGREGSEQAKAVIRDTLTSATEVSDLIPKSALRGNYDLIHVYSEKTKSTVSIRVLPGNKYEFDTLIPEKSNRF